MIFRLKLFLPCIASLAVVTACTAVRPHATEAELLVTKGKEAQQYEVASEKVTDTARSWAGSNPVKVFTDSKFVVSINHIHAGWLHNDWQNARNADPRDFPAWRRSHYRGKELWLLTTIRSLDPADPLEVNSKLYVNATNVKFDSGSFSFVPLDAAERDVFTHDSDKSYRIRFQLFEVDGFALKRELVRIAQSPGILGAAEDLLLTLKGTAGAVAGDIVKNMFDRWKEEPLAFERLLLTLGATEEFRGDVLIVRDGKHPASNLDLVSSDKENLEEDRYLLMDPFKESELYSREIRTENLSGPEKFLKHKSSVLNLDFCWEFFSPTVDTDGKVVKKPANAECEGLQNRTFLSFTVSQVPAQDLAKKKALQAAREKLADQQSKIAALDTPTSGEKVTTDNVETLKLLAATMRAEKRKQINVDVTLLEGMVNKRGTLNREIAQLKAQIAENKTKSENLAAPGLTTEPDGSTADTLEEIQDLKDSTDHDENSLTRKTSELTDIDPKILELHRSVVAALQGQGTELKSASESLSRLLEIQSKPYD